MIIDMQFIDGVWYVTEDAGALTRYDESATQDWDGLQNADVQFKLRLNKIKPSDRWSLLKNIAVGYNASAQGTVKTIVDTGEHAKLTPPGNNFIQRQVSGSDFTGGNNRGRAVAMELLFNSGTVEIFDVNFNIEIPPQKSLIRGNA